jgi:hypothetical protein
MLIIILGLVLLCIGAVGLVTGTPFDEPMKPVDFFCFCALLCGLAIFAWVAG